MTIDTGALHDYPTFTGGASPDDISRRAVLRTSFFLWIHFH
jgi:hypothetical protein